VMTSWLDSRYRRDFLNMPEKRVNKTSIEGRSGNVEFSISGPPELVSAIAKFIKNLTTMSGGYSE